MTAVIPQDPGVLESCCICLQPLWNARPSVFVVNSQRLCPHYFCEDCAQRAISEATVLVKVLQESMALALVDGLPSVLDTEGQMVGDLVWRHSGVRISEGEFAVILQQLERMSDLQEGMELRYDGGQASVWKDGVHCGRLLRASPYALKVPSEAEFEADGLEGVLTPRNANAIRARYIVLNERDGTWHCERCSLENSAANLRCQLCHAAPPKPSILPKATRVLQAAALAALRRRFAIRPRINWAVKLECPLCRRQGVASVRPLPLLSEEPHAWFRLADVDGAGRLTPSSLAHALAAALPVSYEELREQLEGTVSTRMAVPEVPRGVSLSEFLSEGGVAQWACQYSARIREMVPEGVHAGDDESAIS